MIQSAYQHPISNIFGIDTVKYVIPRFQREYVWRREHWENLFNDLLDNEKGYFLGTVISIPKIISQVLGNTEHEIIDGQQRLITISLLYAAIYERYAKETRTDDDFIAQRTNLKYKLIQKHTNELKLQLSEQNQNLIDYISVLNEIKILNNANKPSNLGNRKIYRAYQYFKKRISDYEFEKIIEILEKIDSAVVVKIDVNSHSDAYVLFESLNNRGEPLSPIDLIKNNVLSELENREIKSIEDAFSEWIKLVENLSDYPIQERFLRQYYNAFRYRNEIKIKGIPKATKSNLIKIYEELIKTDVNLIFNELVEKSKMYSCFIKPQNNENHNAYSKKLTDLLHIQAAPSYTFLLYLFCEHKDNIELIEESIDFLVKYFVRRNLTDIPGTRDLDSIFIGLVDECEKNKNNLSSQIIINYLTQPNRFARLEIFEEKLRGHIYEENVDVARFILCKMEETHQTKEIYTDLWKKDDNKYAWTIEHIFPEGDNIPKPWVDMISNGNYEEAKKLKTDWAHKLGNLTLTGYNPTLGNLSFEKKRDRQDNKGDYVGYKNGLYLNKELCNKDTWTIKDIQARNDKLINQASELFRISNENSG
ncbi:MAG: DUF262 domain-containing HNH endonuclease family protein [Candidatus Methanoperedens sp.]|nr:DUF262 domain-containing HNH endonuclease family protein [Candidatus Methanoperedens sp.]